MSLSFSTLEIALVAAVMLHVTEEFLYPGGFPEWYARLVPPKTVKKSNTGFLVWINTLMMCACAFALYFGSTPHGYSIWYFVASIAAANACFHNLGRCKTESLLTGRSYRHAAVHSALRSGDHPTGSFR